MQLFQNDSDVTLIVERKGEPAPFNRILIKPGETLNIGLGAAEWNLKIDPPIRIIGIAYKADLEPKKIVDTGLFKNESNPDARQS